MTSYVQNVTNETENESITSLTDNETISAKSRDNHQFIVCLNNVGELSNKTCDLSCRIDESLVPDCVTGTTTFWMFVLFMCLGTIGFNVTNCASDATCFDILGKYSTITCNIFEL